ncbi:hypothetical protein [Wolbachia endosymbiont of Oedothorax gibbosus]|uniref:hypothetical protein n=1 Tax=Wolbachia endosymbiont of Oedothorax gibbosus TaxID=931100 RepID=UPI002024F3AD|nr:hypothetical protein [Wolbachia endosymbiont of Oedothorax gibbosus]
MEAGLKFESVVGTATADLTQVKIVTLQDNTGNKYTLDVTGNDLKLIYHKHGNPQPTEYTVNGLATALGKLLTIDGNTAGKSVLAEEVAKKEVVEAIFDAKDGSDKISETKIGTTFAKKTDLNNKANTADVYTKKNVDDELAKKADTSALADKANSRDVYTKHDVDTSFVKTDGSNADAIANAFAKNPTFTNAIAINPAVNDANFPGAVRGVMSQPYCDIPEDESAPISAVW